MKSLNHIRTGILIVMLSFLARASAQDPAAPDTIILHNGRSLVAFVDEIGLDAITYHVSGNSIRRSIDKLDVASVKFHTGETEKFSRDPMDAQLAALSGIKKHVVKIDVLSPAANHLVLGYEHVLMPWMNVEAKVGIIGVGIAKQEDTRYSGFMLKAGIKFISRPAVVMRGMRLNSLVRGSYVKPELIFSSYSAKLNGVSADPMNGHSTVKNGDFAFNLVFGNQHQLGGCATVDAFFGLGFGSHRARSGDEVNKDSGESKLFGVTIGPSSFPIALSAGLTFGVAF
ncbi:MAG: hypothetical protein JSS77_06535 [Acidobacteria bacterium]|nr:hypothetical protein [Acidobacteriota bacterium]